MKKCLICILFIAIFSFATGCGLIAPASQEPSEHEESMEETAFIGGMELVGESPEGRFFYYRDTVTDIIYLFCRSSIANTQGGGLTVMLDPESGLPLSYTRYMELSYAPAAKD